ncbi:MAG TPA: M23 family metallopeptidase, partial [Thermomicrobiales bacterium]|nr:M23 family metallopeptidase [Thermomicrobiales bacterium]
MLGPGHRLFTMTKGSSARRLPRPHRFFSMLVIVLLLASMFAGVVPTLSPPPVAASHATMRLPVPSGATWTIGQGYNTRPTDGGTHWNCDPAVLRDQPTRTESCRAHYQYKFSLDLARADGNTAGQPVLAPANGVIRWIDLSTGGISIDLGDGYAFAFFHANLVPGLQPGQQIQRGQRLGTVSPPGQGANGGWPHLHITLWQTGDGGNWSRVAVPFTDNHALEGYDFPFLGESSLDQHRGRTLSSTNQEIGGAAPTLSAPALQSPATGTSYRTYAPRPNLTWSPVSGATGYQVVVNDGQMTSPWLTGTSWTMPTLTNGQYAWQVRARSSTATGPLSPKWVLWVDTSNATPPPTPPPSGSLGVKVSPSTGQVGGSFSIMGTGFGPGEAIRVYVDSASNAPIGAAAATSAGSFATTVTMPDASAGTHRFIARGMSTGRVTAAVFTVTPSLQRTPYRGTPGTAVTVTVKGFGAYESVRLSWDTASGAYLGAAQTNAAGTGTTTIRIPQASEGWHDYVGTGSRTGARGYGAINVLSPAPVGGGGGSSGGGQIVGPGSYRITATREGLVGGTTSSGHVIVADDHFVSLPACTATSCPWLTPGVRHQLWGLRVECGSRCYVRVTNVANGACSVAPIYDVGPWFTNDDWWNPTSARILNNLATTENILRQGYTGADAARDGLDVGYGQAPSGIGISNKGYEVGNRASLDIADGTWVDLGIAMGAGIAPNGIIATMLWQSGEDPLTAARGCGQTSPNAGRGSSPTPQPLPPPPGPSTPATFTISGELGITGVGPDAGNGEPAPSTPGERTPRVSM